jgi:reactive intermediate/imine deaminase
VARRREIDVPGQAEPISHYAHAVLAEGQLLFVSGVVPVDDQGCLVGGGDVVAQARAVFDNLGAVLAAAGATFADVAKVTIFLTDVDDRPRINPVREEVFGAARPASTLVEVSRLAVEGARLEVEAIAVLAPGPRGPGQSREPRPKGTP